MILSEAEFHEALTLDQASEMLARFGSEARLMMGGTDLLVDLKKGRVRASHIVSLTRIASLQGIAGRDDGVRIGALTTINQLARSTVIQERFPAILDAARVMAAPQLR